MRFRLIRRGPAGPPPLPATPPPAGPRPPAPPPAAGRAPTYGRYYGTARKREDLRK